jgi:hypothetical protein
MTKRVITDADIVALKAKIGPDIDAWFAGLAPVEEPPPVVVPPAAGGTAWLSGVADSVPTILKWGAFRGSPATYARVWADADRNNQLNLYAMGELTSAGWDGVLDLACGGPSDWTLAAAGGWDATWRAQCRKALSLWGNLRQLHLSMAHEFNNGYPWHVTSANQANFRKAWPRWFRIVQEELVAKGKNAKVVLSCNADTNGGWSLAGGLPDPSTFDIYGVDDYNFWPAVMNQEQWDAKKSSMKGDTPRGFEAHVVLATELKKPISVPEWGLAPSGDFPVDVPFYVKKMRETFARLAPADPYNPGPGQLAGEAFFNVWPGHGQIYPTAINAAASAVQYQRLKWGAAQ